MKVTVTGNLIDDHPPFATAYIETDANMQLQAASDKPLAVLVCRMKVDKRLLFPVRSCPRPHGGGLCGIRAERRRPDVLCVNYPNWLTNRRVNAALKPDRQVNDAGRI